MSDVATISPELQAVLANQRTWHIETANVFDGLAMLPDNCIHAVVTSPPYWGLRSYLPDGHANKSLELGSERTPEEYIENQVRVFREVRRVLRGDGVCWLNIGDSYNAYNGNRGQSNSISGLNGEKHPNHSRGLQADSLKPTDLVGTPWMLAFALRADGWYLRNDCIWHKSSPMPESVSGWHWRQCRVKVGRGLRAVGEKKTETTNGKPHGGRTEDGKNFDSSAQWEPCPGCPKCIPNGGLVLRKGSWRHTRAHEYVFMLTKSDRYFCDSEAVAEMSSASSLSRLSQNVNDQNGSTRGNGGRKTNGTMKAVGGETRNPRSVIKLSNEPFKGSHFATFPTRLITPLLSAATSEKGCCPACGIPWSRIIEKTREATRPATNNKRRGKSGPEVGNVDPERHISRTITKGWKASCACHAGEPIPCLVIDPFNGAGTTGVVARRLGLRYIGLELNEQYAEMSRKRIKADLPLMN